MGILDRLFRKSAPPPEPEGGGAPGWDAIDAALARVYGSQKPKHFANAGVRWIHDLSGNANPLDGAHIFDAGTFWHYVGLGLSELYGKDSDDARTSGLGYELTFRLAKQADEPLPPTWPIDMMNGIARPVMLGKLVLDAGHTIKTGPLSAEGDGERYVALLVHEDPSLAATDTPHGRLKFLQLVPVDAPTFARAQNGNAPSVLAELAAEDPDLVFRIRMP